MRNKVASGQKLKNAPTTDATFINDLVDVVDAFNRNRLSPQYRESMTPPRPDVVWVQNLSGGSRVAGDVMQIYHGLISPADRRHPWFTAWTPGMTSSGVAYSAPTSPTPEAAPQNCVVLLQPAAANDIVQAQASGICLANIMGTSVYSGQSALAVLGQNYFAQAAFGGVAILDIAGVSSGSVKQCWIDLSESSWSPAITSNRNDGQCDANGYYDCTATLAGVSQSVWLTFSDFGSTAHGTAPSGSATCYNPAPFFFFSGESISGTYAGTYDPFPGGAGGTSDPRPLFTAIGSGSGLYPRVAVSIASWVGSSGVPSYCPARPIDHLTGYPFRLPYGPLTDRAPAQTGAYEVMAYDHTATGGVKMLSCATDEPIGTVRLVTATHSATAYGWAPMDGSANSTANGGSGIDMRGFIPRGVGSSFGVGASIGSDDVDLSEISDHPPHVHNYSPLTATILEGDGTNGSNVAIVPPFPDTTGATQSGGAQPTLVGHYAAGTYSQTLTGANIPAAKGLQFIERINNSQTSVT